MRVGSRFAHHLISLSCPLCGEYRAVGGGGLAGLVPSCLMRRVGNTTGTELGTVEAGEWKLLRWSAAAKTGVSGIHDQKKCTHSSEEPWLEHLQQRR